MTTSAKTNWPLVIMPLKLSKNKAARRLANEKSSLGIKLININYRYLLCPCNFALQSTINNYKFSKTSSNMLKNAPLKEVIFELYWELDFIPQQKIYIDNGFEEAVMNFRNSCQQDFKEFQLLVPPGIPSTALNNRVTHRFFKEKGKHPIYQMGPGVFTVNDNNKNYSWEEFRKLILSGMKCLKSSYTKELAPAKIELRYIDAVDCGIFDDADKFEFLKKYLNVSAESYQFVDGKLIDINFSKRFLIDKDSYLNITVATGKNQKSNEDIIIWHTVVNNKERIPWNALEEWIDYAHSICSLTFKKMVNQRLYEYFS